MYNGESTGQYRQGERIARGVYEPISPFISRAFSFAGPSRLQGLRIVSLISISHG